MVHASLVSLVVGAACVAPASCALLRSSNLTAAVAHHVAPQSFQSFYEGYAKGPGIWKWNNALAAYQSHFAGFANLPVSVAEVGIQSGGSVVMWQSVLGSQCHVYGLDINPAVNKFANTMTTITIGDQADVNMWVNFFDKTAKSLDVLVDDGGYEPLQMLVTLEQSFHRMNPGGFVAIEDIHGQHYLESFFRPSAAYLSQQATQGNLDSVHVYPFLLIAQRTGKSEKLPRSQLAFGGSTQTVADFEQLWQAVPNHKGGHVVLQNSGWGPFLTEQGLINFFNHFGALHDGDWYDVPAGCQHTAAALCTNIVRDSDVQSQVTGIHIYADRMVVEVASSPAVIQAVRRGDTWLDYR